MKTIYYNAKVYTCNPDQPYANSFLVENGCIQWVGDVAAFTKGEATESVNLQGKRVLPAFIDSHMHALQLAASTRQISCLPPQVHSISELCEQIKEAHKNCKEGDWIEGCGYDEGKFAEHRSPNRWDLDAVSPDIPVTLLRTCAHIRCVNSKALELAGITHDTPDPEGGIIERDENGEPTGILKENARDLIPAVMPAVTVQQRIDDLLALDKLLLSQGITAVTDMGGWDDTDLYDIYQQAAMQGFHQEVGVYYFWEFFADKEDFRIPTERFQSGQQIRAAGIKLIGDGSISGRTAWLNAPYLNSEEYGISVCSDDLLEDAIQNCKEYQCQLSIHAMGGRTIDRFLSRLETEKSWLNTNQPFVRMEHITEPSEESIALAARMGVGFVTQPIFLFAEIESYLSNLGAERLQKTYPIRTLLEKGVKTAISTDSPATSWAVPSDPMVSLKAAVTRTAYEGTDCGQKQAIDIETAIGLYTKEGAEIAGFADLGQIRPGYKANFIVLDQDILNIDPVQIDQVHVECTYCKGEKVYERK